MRFYSVTDHLFSPVECLTFFQSYTFTKETIETLFSATRDYAKELKNDEVMETLHRIEEKYKNKRRTIAFCGHFSAGKSTLMNQLIGTDMLPSHPIPTSANVVHIKKGEKVTFSYKDRNDQTFVTFTEKDWDENLFTNNEHTDEIYMTLPHDHLPHDVELLDTPGIDSTDSRHQQRAESRLSEADIIYYVVDYQQVESEQNFQFLKALNRQYMYPILIVNQMDKHHDTELSLELYQQKLETSLHKHSILLKDIYFVSALFPDAYSKDWQKLMGDIYSSIHPEKTIYQTAALSLYRVLKEMSESIERTITPTVEQLTYMNTLQTYTQLQTHLEELKEALEQLPTWPTQMEKAMLREVEKVFANAKLTPYHTRNHIYDYLESRQRRFRMKGIFTKQKTAIEKEQRLERLLQSVNENVRNYINIHLHEGLRRILSSYSMDHRKMKQMIQKISHEVDVKMIKQSERKGALFTREYVLMYSRLLTDTIRKKYKESVVYFFQQIKKDVIDAQQKEKERLKQKINALMNLEKDWKEWEETYQKIITLLDEAHLSLQRGKQPIPLVARKYQRIPLLHDQRQSRGAKVDLQEFYQDEKRTMYDFKELKRKTLAAAESVVQILRPHKSFANHLESLQKRKIRLEHKTYRISLFGSFSTGKSSIANALLGEKILPTAANPTTATVQYIKYPTEAYPHKTVVITYKTEADIVSDMNDILRSASTSLTSLEDWPRMVQEREEWKKEKQKKKKDKKEDEQRYHPLDLLYEEELARLHDYYDSYQTYAPSNTAQTMSLHTYQTLAMNEAQAMLMKDATIYFACDFTKQGYELTDTPGVGSIYRRHSEVAFHEMKQADAILFISYYNHSFSKDDREFLMQLGRIQDFFSYDKMFFLVNAADLAKSNEEVSEVLQYVKKELTYFGIQSPRVLPVSSKMALEERELSKSGFKGFLQSFRNFHEQSLEKIVMEELQSEVKRIFQSLKERQRAFQLEEEERKTEIKQSVLAVEQFIKKMKQYQKEEDVDRIRTELEELLFYVKQRVFYRYFDEFKELFAIVQFDKDQFQARLERATNNMIQFVFHHLTEEIRATVIRIEYFIQLEWKEIQRDLFNVLPEQIRPAFITHELSPFPEVVIQESVPLRSRDIPFLSQYNSYTDFFVENKKETFKDQLEAYLRPFGDRYVDDFHQLLEKTYVSYVEKELQRCLDDLVAQARAYIGRYEDESFTQNESALLQQAVEQIEKVLTHL